MVGGGREGKGEREGRAWVGCAGGSWSNLFVVMKLSRSERRRANSTICSEVGYGFPPLSLLRF